MMHLILSIGYFVLLFNFAIVASSPPLGLFATKTPYSYIQNNDINIHKPESKCIVKQINMVHRHGHRFPGHGGIKDFQTLAIKINQANSTMLPTVNLSLPWTPPYDINDASHLTHVGENELYQMGRRIKQRFPTLFTTTKYSSKLFSFVSTNKLRTTHSSSSLAAGLFDENGSIDKRIQPIALETMPKDPNDKLLRFYEACPNYKTEIDDNIKTLMEYQKFGNGLEVKEVIANVQRKLGNQNLGINFDNLAEIYEACAYEVGMFGGSLLSGLCDLLSEPDRTTMEYAADLDKFYQVSNVNNSLTYKISCPLIEDIYETLSESRNESHYKGIFRSAHSSTMLMLYTLLGLNEQATPLKHDNFADQKDREFRSSTISPFSANVYFILYECSGRMKIQLYWNERLQKIPCCHSKVDCDLTTFLECYEGIVDGCKKTFENLCTKSSSAVAVSMHHLIVIASLVLLSTAY